MSMVTCKNCSRDYNADVLKTCPACRTPLGAAAPPAPIEAVAGPPARRPEVARGLSTRWTDLQEDAGRVAAIFSTIAWIILIVGALSGAVALFVGLANDSVWSGLVGVAIAAAYTAAGWAFVMLGAVAARYIALTATERANP